MCYQKIFKIHVVITKIEILNTPTKNILVFSPLESTPLTSSSSSSSLSSSLLPLSLSLPVPSQATAIDSQKHLKRS
jgi:hypothetical protein